MEGTNLQDLYDRFFSKTDEDFSFKAAQIFALVDSAIAKSYKNVNHSLDYELTDTDDFEGHFIEELDSDEIELLALWMLYEWNRKRQQKLRAQKTMIGTKDFNRLEDRPRELREVTLVMKDIMEEINALKNEFNTYKY